MLHIQVLFCFTYHLHVSMYPCLLLKVRAEYDLQLRACSEKRLLRCLCSCTLCEGIHAQVTSQRGSGAPGKREASHWWRYPLVEATGYPVCFTQVKVTGVSSLHFAQVKMKRDLPGLDPRITQWPATLL